MSLIFEEIACQEIVALEEAFRDFLEQDDRMILLSEFMPDIRVDFYAPHPVVRPLQRDFDSLNLEFPSSDQVSEIRVLAKTGDDSLRALFFSRSDDGPVLHRIDSGLLVDSTVKGLQAFGSEGRASRIAYFSFEELNRSFLWSFTMAEKRHRFLALNGDLEEGMFSFRAGQVYSFGEIVRFLLSRELLAQAPGAGR